jgi:hypothetical protein
MKMPFCLSSKMTIKEQIFGRWNFLVPIRVTVHKQIKAGVWKMPLLLSTMVTVKE